MQFLIVFKARKYCETIMNALLLFTLSKSSHIAKLEDILKALLKNGLENIPKEMSVIWDKFAIYGQGNIYKGQKFLC